MKLSVKDNRVYLSLGGVGVMLLCSAPGVWRVITEYNGTFDERGAAQTLAEDLGESIPNTALPLEVRETRVYAQGSGYAETANGVLSFFNEQGVCRRTITSVSVKNGSTFVKVKLDGGEKLFGTGERFNAVNQRGKRVQLYAIDRWCQTHGNSYVPIPFLVSDRNASVFVNRYEHSVFNMGFTRRNTLKIEQKYAPADMYIFMSANPADVLREYCKLTGFAPVPADWCFGTQVCRYSPEFKTKEGVFAMIDAMKENDFPWDAAIIESWGIYNRSRWDELRQVSERVHAEGKKLMAYEQCGRFPGQCEEFFGLDNSYAVDSSTGPVLHETRSLNLVDNFHHKNMRCIDLTSPKAMAKWNEIWGTLVDDIGVDGAKIDFCEQFPDRADLRFADGRNPMGAHHWYPVLYNTLRYRHFASKPDGGMNFSRGGGIGAQRYPFIWAGDQRREFYFLAPVLRAALSLGLSGVPFVSWDMAGYQPSFNLYDRIHEDKVFIRGIEFTAFSANIQTHGRVKRPYDFDEGTRAIYRRYAKLHDCLRPYLLEQARVSAETGLPIMRHLFLYDSTDSRCTETEDEYMLGCGLLVAPVLKNAKSRKIYLPKGSWVNIFTGEKFAGGTTFRMKVPLDSIPVFRLEGAPSAVLSDVLESAGLR